MMSARCVSLPRDDKRGQLGMIMTEWQSTAVIVGFDKDSPADRCDRLYIGDAILSVNGTRTQSRALSDVKRLLKEAGPRVTMTVRHARCLDQHFDDPNVRVSSWRGWPGDSCDHQWPDPMADGSFLVVSPNLSSVSLMSKQHHSDQQRQSSSPPLKQTSSYSNLINELKRLLVR